MLAWATLDTCNCNFTLCEVLPLLHGLERSWSAGTLHLPEVTYPLLFWKMLAEQSWELICCVDQQSCNPIPNAQYPLCMGKEGPRLWSRRCHQSSYNKDAICEQEPLKLLDEQVVPTKGKRQHLQRCCLLTCQWDILNINKQSLLWFVIPCRAAYPSLEDALSIKSNNLHRLVKAREMVIFTYWNLHISALLQHLDWE